MYCLACSIASFAGESVALLHRDAADRLADAVLDDPDEQRLRLAVELAGDQPFPSNCDGADGS
jgi:hypothetical protein